MVFIKPFNLFCQEVLKPPKYPDGVYTKERSVSQRHLTWDVLNTPIYTFDTSLIISAENKINYFKTYYSSAPLKLNECIYISPAKYFGIELINRNAKSLKVPSPHSFLFYSDTIAHKDALDFFTGYDMYLKLKKTTEDLYQPFYFKKTEVTNKEYREFVYWVVDSIARRLLAEDGDSKYFIEKKDYDGLLLNKKEKISWNDTLVNDVLEQLYLPPEERFYNRRELDSRRMLYKYSINGITEVINVYPDTLVWTKDFQYGAFLEAYVNIYFWHPAYDDYPVVGISQEQAKAFLAWKTHQKQEELDRQQSKYIVHYELPNEMEWEMIATESEKMIYDPEYRDFYDSDFTTSLLLKEDTCMVVKITKENNLEAGTKINIISFPANIRQKPVFFFHGGLIPWQPYLFRSNLKMKKGAYSKTVINAYKDEIGIEFMGGNVSEWMSDTYKDNWLPIYTYHQNKLKKINTKYSKQLLNIERIYNSQNDTNGVLVRGGNWFDLSLSSIGSKNFEGMNKKRFVDPMKAYSTVGFRYVVKVFRKDEQELLQNQTKTK